MSDTKNVTLETVHGANQGTTTLNVKSCTGDDLGIYKVIVRNMLGQAVHRFRLVLGVVPCVCESPEIDQVSDSEVLLKWKAPLGDDGGAPPVCYHLQIKPEGEYNQL